MPYLICLYVAFSFHFDLVYLILVLPTSFLFCISFNIFIFSSSSVLFFHPCYFLQLHFFCSSKNIVPVPHLYLYFGIFPSVPLFCPLRLKFLLSLCALLLSSLTGHQQLLWAFFLLPHPSLLTVLLRYLQPPWWQQIRQLSDKISLFLTQILSFLDNLGSLRSISSIFPSRHHFLCGNGISVCMNDQL